MNAIRWLGLAFFCIFAVVNFAQAGLWDKAAKVAKGASQATKKSASAAEEASTIKFRPTPGAGQKIKDSVGKEANKTCPNCHGKGWWLRCVTCEGSGYVSVYQSDNFGNHGFVQQRCRSCGGKGVRPCEVCNGTGKVP